MSPACFAYEIGLDRPVPSSCQPPMSGQGLIQGLGTPTLRTAADDCVIDDAWYARGGNDSISYANFDTRDVTIKTWGTSKSLLGVTTSGNIIIVPLGEIYAGGSRNLSWTGSIIAQSIDFNGTGSGGGNAGFLALSHRVFLVH